jgi:hypothetical protein
MIDSTDRGRGYEDGPRHAAVISDSAGSLQTRMAPCQGAGLDAGAAILAVVRSSVERVTGGKS